MRADAFADHHNSLTACDARCVGRALELHAQSDERYCVRHGLPSSSRTSIGAQAHLRSWKKPRRRRSDLIASWSETSGCTRAQGQNSARLVDGAVIADRRAADHADKWAGQTNDRVRDVIEVVAISSA